MRLFKQEKKKILIFDIGGKSVGAGLVILEDKKRPTVLNTLRRKISLDNPVENEKIIANFVEESIIEITKRAKDAPSLRGAATGAYDQILFVLRLPWYESANKRVKLKKKELFTVSNGLLTKILDEEEKNFENSITKEKIARFDSGAVMIERQPVRIRLNGYDTLNPIQKKTTDLDISIYMSIAPDSILKHVQKVALKHVHTKGVSFHSFPLVFFESIMEIFPREQNALLVDIGAKDTEVLLLKHRALEKSTSFPSGWGLIEKKVSDMLSVPMDIASSFIRTYLDKQLDSTTESLITEAIENSRKDWLSHIHKSLSETFESKISSNVIFLATESDFLPLFENFLKEDKELTKLFGEFRIYGFNESIIKNAVNFRSGGDIDPFLSMSAIFMQRHNSFLV